MLRTPFSGDLITLPLFAILKSEWAEPIIYVLLDNHAIIIFSLGANPDFTAVEFDRPGRQGRHHLLHSRGRTGPQHHLVLQR